MAILLIFLNLALGLSSCALLAAVWPDDADTAAAVETEAEPWRPRHGYFLATTDGDVVMESRINEDNNLRRQTRYYLFPDGDYFYQQRVEYQQTQSGDNIGLALLRMSGAQATLRYWDAESNNWVVAELLAGVYPARQYFIVTDQEQAIVVPPQAYAARDNDMLEALPDYDGQLAVEKTADGYALYLQGKAGDVGLIYDYF